MALSRIKVNVLSTGFSLLELVFVLALSSACSLFLASHYLFLLRATSLNTSELDAVLKQQQLTYFFRQMLAAAGQYNMYDDRNKSPTEEEQALLINHPVVLPMSFSRMPNLGVVDGPSDRLVLNLVSDVGCNGRRFHYRHGEQFHLVNEVFIQDNTLRCRSYDGRFLTGLTNTSSRVTSVSLLNGVQVMQVRYLIRLGTDSQYVDASELSQQDSIAAVRLELLIAHDSPLLNKVVASMSLLSDEENLAQTERQKILLFLPLKAGT